MHKILYMKLLNVYIIFLVLCILPRFSAILPMYSVKSPLLYIKNLIYGFMAQKSIARF